MKSVNLALALLTGSSALALAAVAHAQTAPAAAPAEEVIVTGSRVIKNGNNSPTPVTVVPIEDMLRVSPNTVGEALDTLPQFSGSRMPTSNPSTGTAQNNGGGVSQGNLLNLRNMGAVRTLILFDGHRVPATTVNGVVDVDMIPQQLLQRVDVVTGGASAVYGSDAVIGVVNFVTNRNFNGLKANAQYGVTQKGDDRNYSFGIAAGRGFADGRLHVEGSYEFRNDDGIPYRSSRDPNHNDWTPQGLGTAASPYGLVAGARVTAYTFGGLIPGTTSTTPGCTVAPGCGATANPLGGQTFDQNGVLNPFIHGAPAVGVAGTTPTPGIELGGDGIYWDSQLKGSLRSHQLFGRLDYDVTDKVHAYVEVAGNDKLGKSFTNWIQFNQLLLNPSDAYLPASYQSAMAAAKQTSFKFSKQLMDAPRVLASVEERQLLVNAGLEGELGKYKWEVGIVHGSARLQQTVSSLDNGKLFASLDAVKNTSGNVVCNVTITNPGLYPGCVPLNPFGPTSDSPAAVAYFTTPTLLTADTSMDDASGSFSGAPFSTWAGPVNAAISGEWRKIGYKSISTFTPSSFLSCTGLRFNCTQGTTLVSNSTTLPRSLVTQTVSEGAFEADVPLLKDMPFAQSFNLNGAVRYTAYSTSGDYWTWKIGLDYHLNDEIRFRGTRSRDIRAPTLDDLYSPQTITTGGTFNDPLTHLVASPVSTIGGGNPNLTAETGDTWSGGVVLKPSFVPGFTLSIDYFNIKVTNALSSLLAMNVTYQQSCVASGGTAAVCSLFVRPLPYSNTTAANNVTAVRNEQVNIAEQDTNGVDVEANYATRLFDRPASVRWLMTYQPNLLQILTGTPTQNQAGAAFGASSVQATPAWRDTIFLRYSPFDNFNIDVQTRWRSSLRLSGDPSQVIASGRIPAVSFTDLALAYTLKSSLGSSEMFLNISNVFDTPPPPAGYYGGQTVPGQQTGYVTYDDPIGRAFTVGVRFKH